ncbi:radical SAM/SPASM domain-containing protein [Phormidesmis sp. 146-35]
MSLVSTLRRYVEKLLPVLEEDSLNVSESVSESASERVLPSVEVSPLQSYPEPSPEPSLDDETDEPPFLEPSAQNRPLTVTYPFTIFNIELTNRCPFKCVMCARTNNMTRAQGLMEFDLFQRAIDEFVMANPKAARESEVWLHGFGESLVHPEFAKLMRYASDRGLQTALSINPFMLTERVAHDLLEAHPAHLYCSLDGHDNASFEQIRGVKNAYDLSKQRLLDFLKRKVEGGYQTRITLSMINFPLNEGSIQQLGDYWRSIPGIDEFLSKSFINWDGNAQDVNVLAASQTLQKPYVTCDFPWRRMTIKWDGDVVPCCLDYDKRYVLGNLNHQTLADIWNGAPMQALRQEFISNEVTNPLCRNCEQLRA